MCYLLPMTRRLRALSVQYVPDRPNSCTFIMKVLFLLFILSRVNAKDGFGTSYLKDRRLCQEWTCINSKLGLTDSLPSRAHYSQVLRSILPEEWHGTAEIALDGCYGNRSRRYTNACPGQALVHCTLDQLIENCPEANLRKDDKCSPVSSLAGFKYMTSQGIYENFEANLAHEHRPAWFMRHYFSSKCCNLPDIFSSSMLAECGFTHMMHYNRHNMPASATQAPVMLPSTESSRDGLQIINLPPVADDSTEDPLDCCDMSSFIQPSWRSECGFRMKWDTQDRLTIEQPPATTPTPTTTTTTKPRLDVKVLPLTCAQETCVFRKLNIVSESGTVDLDAFSKLLNNLTTSHPSWAKAKARVITKCLTRPLVNYMEECEVNKVLACTFDVLSQYCPTSKIHDPCRHFNTVPSDIVCQISSVLVPRTRHQYCEIPSLVNEDILQGCSISSLSRLEYSTHPVPVPNRRTTTVHMCHKLTNATTCLLSKMGVLNIYSFMDYFKMKDSIRSFMNTHHELQYYSDAYLTAFDTMPRYSGYCSSPKKLLNLLDAMLMTCPLSKRKPSAKCKEMFNDISQSPAQNRNLTQQELEQIVNQFQHIFIPSINSHQDAPRSSHKVTKKLYDFGILNDGNVPPVRVIDVNPTERPVKVLLPVYQQIYGNSADKKIYGAHNDLVWRGGVGRG